MEGRRRGWRGLLVLWLLVGCPMRLAAQAADALFDPSVLHELRLHVHSADLARLRATFDQNTYYPADLEWRGQRVRNVAIRSRGLGSRNPQKLGLRVDMDRYTSGQTFLGLSSLVLDNLWQDPSLAREPLAMAVFARMGIAAPREGHARLYINGEYEGLYTIVEEVAPAFLGRVFGRDDGYLHEYKWIAPWYGGFLGDDTAAYVPLFEAKTHERASEEVLYAPLRDLVRAINEERDPDAWAAALTERLDVDQLITYLAVETTLSQLDGVLGYAGMNNFYVHRPADGARHVLIPWDQDVAFFDVTSSVWLRVDENVLVRRVLSVSAWRTRYLDELERCVALIETDDWLAAELDRLVAVTDAAARDDVRKQFDEASRAEALEYLRAFVRTRGARVRAEVALARAADGRQP